MKHLRLSASQSPKVRWISALIDGWHVSAKTGHSAKSKNTSGGRWVVEDGAIVGSRDIPATAASSSPIASAETSRSWSR